MLAQVNLAELRSLAVRRSLFRAPDLVEAVRRVGFVQADPIAAPARAQDLILRQRVEGYRAGDLEAQFATLPLTEEFLHLYGFMHREARALLHPRLLARELRIDRTHAHLSKKVLAHVRRRGRAHPRQVAQAIESPSVVNAWGGQSTATTRLLEALHYRGQLEVVDREAGIKIYAPASRQGRAMPVAERARGLVELMVRTYGPMQLTVLRSALAMVRERAPQPLVRQAIAPMIADGTLRAAELDGVTYVWLARELDDRVIDEEVPAQARFLAPFDPLVWDRRRFAQLWGWEYRFEAYTPVAKRKLGYYALPLLWRDQVIGWVSVRRRAESGLAFDVGFVGARPKERAFTVELAAEKERLAEFLRPR